MSWPLSTSKIASREHHWSREPFRRWKSREHGREPHPCSARGEIPQNPREWHEMSGCFGRCPPQSTLLPATMPGTAQAHPSGREPVRRPTEDSPESKGFRSQPALQEGMLSCENMKPRHIGWRCSSHLPCPLSSRCEDRSHPKHVTGQLSTSLPWLLRP